MQYLQYLCPKCNTPMICVSTVSIPPIESYQCFSCGYKSKVIVQSMNAVVLPEELRPEESEETE